MAICRASHPFSALCKKGVKPPQPKPPRSPLTCRLADPPEILAQFCGEFPRSALDRNRPILVVARHTGRLFPAVEQISRYTNFSSGTNCRAGHWPRRAKLLPAQSRRTESTQIRQNFQTRHTQKTTHRRMGSRLPAQTTQRAKLDAFALGDTSNRACIHFKLGILFLRRKSIRIAFPEKGLSVFWRRRQTAPRR